MTSPQQDTIQHAIELGRRAVLFDQEGKHDGAAYFYLEASRVLDRLLLSANLLPAQSQGLLSKCNEYKQRAKTLKSSKAQPMAGQGEKQTVSKRAHFLITQALEADEKGNKEEALHLYIEAVEHCQRAINETSDSSLQENLRKVAKQSLERAENLKGRTETAVKPINPVKAEKSGGADLVTSATALLKISGSASYTEDEKKVLRLTSTINGREYVPFMAGDLQERFAYSMPFSDRHGKLALSPKQQRSLARWARPDEISDDPKIIENVDCFSIKQTVVSDCSFVASLAVSAQYEKRYHKRLITNIIYPQNRNGNPVYNPCGKYMIKLRVNGVARKVIVDDYLPVGKHGEMLCSYSINRSELWVSLLEKAYMKVMGGYDFPGSNSNIDLHALTGWIPERVPLRSNETESFNKEELFKKLYERFHKGDLLVTVATGSMSDAQAERSGLVGAHAYALLNIVEIKGVRLIMLKNPWSHVRWRGNYSELDVVHWTSELKKTLNYDPESAASFDNGVFWIDYDSLCKFFEVAYLSWNPSLFTHTYSTHQCWRAGQGPVRDMYNIGENPQYSLQVRSPGASAVWVLLTRHITEIEDFKENREYITVLVYKNEGKRVYYPSDPYIDGVRINSPHYLCKILQTSPGLHNYTLVVSQFEKINTIFYSLRIYSTCPFELKKIAKPYRYKEEVTNGCWKGASAGGCTNHPSTYPNNPRFQLVVEGAAQATQLLIELKGPKQYQLGFDLFCVSTHDSATPAPFTKKSSGSYRSGFVILEIENVPCGTYHIVPSTYLPGQEGPFFLTVQSSTASIKISRFP